MTGQTMILKFPSIDECKVGRETLIHTGLSEATHPRAERIHIDLPWGPSEAKSHAGAVRSALDHYGIRYEVESDPTGSTGREWMR